MGCRSNRRCYWQSSANGVWIHLGKLLQLDTIGKLCEKMTLIMDGGCPKKLWFGAMVTVPCGGYVIQMAFHVMSINKRVSGFGSQSYPFIKHLTCYIYVPQLRWLTMCSQCFSLKKKEHNPDDSEEDIMKDKGLGTSRLISCVEGSLGDSITKTLLIGFSCCEVVE